MGLSADYQVNPYVFAAIYVGAIPLFFTSVAWIVRNRKRGKPITMPVLSTGLCMSSAYIYLLIAGEGMPVWVYVMVIGLLGYGIYSTFRNIRGKESDPFID